MGAQNVYDDKLLSPAPSIVYVDSNESHLDSPVEAPSSAFAPASGAPESLVPLLPSSPLYPVVPNGPVSQPGYGKSIYAHIFLLYAYIGVSIVCVCI